MKKVRYPLLAILVMVYSTSLFAQEKLKIKFGKITPADFVLPDSAFLKNADAVYLADIGSTDFEGNTNGWFSLKFRRHVRIKINSANGLEAADFAIPMFFDGTDKEKVENLKGVTYNLEDGKVVETELKSNIVFEDKLDKKYWIKKFSMPGVKAGSIIDVAYTISSDFLQNLQPWQFQGEYPRLWSEYEVNIPEFFNYVFLSQGYLPFQVKSEDERQGKFIVTVSGGASASRRVDLDGRVLINRWVIKNVPALKEEPFTSTIRNHISKIEFQMNRYQFSYPNQGLNRDIMGNWATVVNKRNESEYFGANLYKANNWLDDDIKTIVGSTSDTLQKVRKIYDYIRDNFTCTDHYSTYLDEGGLRGIMKKKNGSVAEINLLLVAMLNHEHVEAYPVLLSTRGHGIAHEFYPLMDRYNYTICVALLGDKEYYLDASEPRLGFGKLPLRCYNGPARVITGEGIPVNLNPDELKERKVTTLNLIINDSGKWEGSLNCTLGYYESLSARDDIKEKGRDVFFKEGQKSMPAECVVTTKELDKLDQKDESLVVKYDFTMPADGEDLIYFNPMMGEGLKENPFKSAERSYPVEMPFAEEETYVANVDIPNGYKVDDMPKSAKVMLNEDDGYFEYIIAQQDGKIMLRSKLVIKKANFSPDDYQTLRDFYGYVVKKHGEQIVFKKG